MRIALVDDETLDLHIMAQICQNFGQQVHCQIETVLFENGELFLEAFEKDLFSIVFMDIYMKGLNGISTALKMRERDNNCLLVFLTSSTEFMPDAFSCHAFEYITKPPVVGRVETVLRDALKVLPLVPKYIEIISGRRTIPVFLQDIISAVTDAHYIEISLLNGSVFRSRMTLPEFLHLVEQDPRFILVNKGIVLNADYILDFEDNCCILDNGAKFPVRVRDFQKIEQAVQDYHFEKIRLSQKQRQLY